VSLTDHMKFSDHRNRRDRLRLATAVSRVLRVSHILFALCLASVLGNLFRLIIEHTGEVGFVKICSLFAVDSFGPPLQHGRYARS
jgi:hypothetical protein